MNQTPLLHALENEFGQDLIANLPRTIGYPKLYNLLRLLPAPSTPNWSLTYRRWPQQVQDDPSCGKKLLLLCLFFGPLPFTSISALASITRFCQHVKDRLSRSGIATTQGAHMALFHVMYRRLLEDAMAYQGTNYEHPDQMVLCLDPTRRTQYQLELTPRQVAAWVANGMFVLCLVLYPYIGCFGF